MNKDTKVALVALIIASIMSLYVSIDIISSVFDTKITDIEFYFNLLTPIFILLNIGIIYAMNKGKYWVIKLAFWLYVIQVVGFEIGEWGFSLLMGFNIFVSWSIGDAFVNINLFAAFMSVLLFRAMRSGKET